MKQESKQVTYIAGPAKSTVHYIIDNNIGW